MGTRLVSKKPLGGFHSCNKVSCPRPRVCSILAQLSHLTPCACPFLKTKLMLYRRTIRSYCQKKANISMVCIHGMYAHHAAAPDG